MKKSHTTKVFIRLSPIWSSTSVICFVLFHFSFLHAQEDLEISNLGDVQKLEMKLDSDRGMSVQDSKKRENSILGGNSYEIKNVSNAGMQRSEPKEAVILEDPSELSQSAAVQIRNKKVILAQNLQQNALP